MGCRCKDKRDCSSDIAKIEDIKDILTRINVKNIFVSKELENLASKCIMSFFAVNMNELTREEVKLNEDISELLPNLIKKCEDKIEKLRREYKSMSREDYDYHHRDDD